jgi:hypothetical protein
MRAAPTTVQHKFLDTDHAAVGRKFAKAGIAVTRDMKSDDFNFLFTISSQQVDLADDVITIAGVDCSNFNKNPVVLNAHDSSELPIATSTAPWVSGTALMAIAKFPQPGTSTESDQVAAAIRASLVRGASVGFVPVKWSFSTDSSRPFGVDFQAVRLLEWSVCSVPCNPGCLMIGAVSGKSARRSSRNVPLDDVPAEDNDWQCHGIDTMPIDASDDAFDQAAAKSALLANFSPNGTILEEARDYFLAVDASAPFDASSYVFPFGRMRGGGIVASKVGWRQSFASLEKSSMPGVVISEARSLVDRLEVRLGEVKTAARRRDARALAAKAKSIIASLPDPVPLTREQRIAEAHNFRRVALAALK